MNYLLLSSIIALSITAGLLVFNEVQAKPTSFPHAHEVHIAPQSVTIDGVTDVVWYNYIFNTCAGRNAIPSPEVLITSDTEIKTVKLTKSMSSNTCQMTATKIKADNPNTIEVAILGKEMLSSELKKVQAERTSLKAKISEKNEDLQRSMTKPRIQEPDKQLNKVINELADLRQQYKQVNSEYYRILYILNR